MKVTIKEIAKLAGVSTTTVSQILNGKGERFSEKTKEKVLEIVEKENYKADFFAKNMITKHSQTIGMIVPDYTDLFFSKVISGVEEYLKPLGYMIMLCNSQHSAEEERFYVEEFLHRSVEGIILATPHRLPADHPLFTSSSHTPYILIDRGKNPRMGGKLIVTEYQGAYEGMEYLIKNGHRNIGMIRENLGYYQLDDRFQAYRDCLSNHGIPFKKEFVYLGDLSIEGGYRSALHLLQEKKLTALFCVTDITAIGAYQAVHELGMKVPDDISILGYDGLELSRYLVPKLTTIHQPSFDIGSAAAELLMQRITDHYAPLENRHFNTELVIGGSIKRIDRKLNTC